MAESTTESVLVATRREGNDKEKGSKVTTRRNSKASRHESM
jgi:hypothetical protein